jgi:membrane protease YdiL (CAAX protease family)
VTSPPGRLYRLAWVLYLVMAVGGVLWIGARRGVIPLSLFLDPRTWWRDVLLGAGAGLLLLGLWKGAERTVPLARDLDRQLMAALGPLQPAEVLALALLSGFAEELLFRGAVQSAFGWAPATVAFAVLHSGPGKAFRLWTIFAALAGLLFSGLVVLRGNLCAPMTAHFLVNAVNLWRLTGAAGDSARLGEGENEGEKEA